MLAEGMETFQKSLAEKFMAKSEEARKRNCGVSHREAGGANRSFPGGTRHTVSDYEARPREKKEIKELVAGMKKTPPKAHPERVDLEGEDEISSKGKTQEEDTSGVFERGKGRNWR